VGQKLGGGCCAPLFREGELGPHLTECRLAEAYLHTKWCLHPSSRLATTDQGHRKFPEINGP